MFILNSRAKKVLMIIALASFLFLSAAYSEEILPKETTKTENSQIPARLKLSNNLDIKEVFSASPIIYLVLFSMSVASLAIWLYSIFTFRIKDIIPSDTIKILQNHMLNNDYDKALSFCKSKNSLFTAIMESGISARGFGPQFVVDTMKSEGRRITSKFWQRLALLNDIVLVAPMLGLLGTVIGMFYAFYDINRSIDSIASLFDGLGIAIGTTVAGLIVAIIAMIFYTTLKFRLIKMLNHVEKEAVTLGNLINIKPVKVKQTKD